MQETEFVDGKEHGQERGGTRMGPALANVRIGMDCWMGRAALASGREYKGIAGGLSRGEKGWRGIGVVCQWQREKFGPF